MYEKIQKMGKGRKMLKLHKIRIIIRAEGNNEEEGGETMKRFAMDRLREWEKCSNRKPMIIRGAR